MLRRKNLSNPQFSLDSHKTLACCVFPSQILGLILVRRLLDFIFSQHDLAWIDNILPEKEKKEADKKKKRKGAHEDSDEEVGEEVRLGHKGRSGEISSSSTWAGRHGFSGAPQQHVTPVQGGLGLLLLLV